jgi:hypothetical protein
MLNAGPVDFFADMLQTFQTHGSAKLALLVVILGRKIGKECQNPSLPLYEILTAIVQIITSWFVSQI